MERKIVLSEARVTAVMHLSCMKNPLGFTENKSRQLDELTSRLQSAMKEKIGTCDAALRENASRLAALNPLAVLGRGYAVVYKERSPVNSVTAVAEGDEISIRLSDGAAQCRVEKVTREVVE